MEEKPRGPAAEQASDELSRAEPSAEDFAGVSTETFDEPPEPVERRSASSSAPKVAPDPEVGDTVAGYFLEELLGRGGAGSVFRARRESDGQLVALKVLSAAKVKRARVVQRFFDEVRTASLVSHPGLIRVFDFIEEDEPRRLAYSMELVKGDILRTRLKRDGSLPLRLAMQVGAQVAEAIQALHRENIVHRDLKPENILLTDAEPPKVKLLDYGVVKFLPVESEVAEPQREEKPGAFVGTPRYMAPEQAAGATVTPKADLFALGVLLFEMLTGRCPHEGDSLRDVVMAKLEGAPRILVDGRQEVLPAELTDIVDSCLKLKPSDRPYSAARIAAALREADMVIAAAGSVRMGSTGEFERPSSRPSAAPRASSYVGPGGKERLSSRPMEAPVPVPVAEVAPAVAEPSRTWIWVVLGVLFLSASAAAYWGWQQRQKESVYIDTAIEPASVSRTSTVTH